MRSAPLEAPPAPKARLTRKEREERRIARESFLAAARRKGLPTMSKRQIMGAEAWLNRNDPQYRKAKKRRAAELRQAARFAKEHPAEVARYQRLMLKG